MEKVMIVLGVFLLIVAMVYRLKYGLNLDSLNTKVLNKRVTLHLTKVLGSFAIFEHVLQMTIEEDIIFTEFN